MDKRKQAVTLFKEAWVWSQKEEWLYKQLCEGFTLHLCSGKSMLGDLKVDLILKADIKADMYASPFKDESFDTVICDPPWFGPKNWDEWKRFVDEICRVAKHKIVLVLGNLMLLLPKPWKLFRVYILKRISPQVKVVYVWEKGIG
ncbi:MAG: methyltransferase domain-containing protein [Candidatus Aenigmatarchaeota archaeon]